MRKKFLLVQKDNCDVEIIGLYETFTQAFEKLKHFSKMVSADTIYQIYDIDCLFFAKIYEPIIEKHV